MKTRNGFVSNSSSSSFIAILTEDAFEEAVSRLKDERHRKIIRVIAQSKKVFGQKMKIVKEYTDAGGFSSVWGDYYDGDDEGDILKKAKVRISDTDDDFTPSDCVWLFSSEIDGMLRKKEWKDKIFSTDVGDNG